MVNPSPLEWLCQDACGASLGGACHAALTLQLLSRLGVCLWPTCAAASTLTASVCQCYTWFVRAPPTACYSLVRVMRRHGIRLGMSWVQRTPCHCHINITRACSWQDATVLVAQRCCSRCLQIAIGVSMKAMMEPLQGLASCCCRSIAAFASAPMRHACWLARGRAPAGGCLVAPGSGSYLVA